MVETHRLIVDRHEDDLVVVARGRPPSVPAPQAVQAAEQRLRQYGLNVPALDCVIIRRNSWCARSSHWSLWPPGSRW